MQWEELVIIFTRLLRKIKEMNVYPDYKMVGYPNSFASQQNQIVDNAKNPMGSNCLMTNAKFMNQFQSQAVSQAASGEQAIQAMALQQVRNHNTLLMIAIALGAVLLSKMS